MTPMPPLHLPGDLPPPDQLWRVGEGALPTHAWDASLVQVQTAEAGAVLQGVMRGLSQAAGAPVVLAVWQRGPVAVIGVFDTGRQLRGCRQLRQLFQGDRVFTALALNLACLDTHDTGKLVRQGAQTAAA